MKEALRAADEKMPYRGPELYQSGEYTYRCKVTGDFTWFQGAVNNSFIFPIVIWS